MKKMKKTISLTLAASIIICGGYMFFEPELAKSDTADTAISLTVTGEINLNCSSTAALSPNIPGQSGGTATGTFGCVVETSNSTGYNMTIEKDQKLQIADVADQRFDDYTTSSASADYDWGAVGGGNEEFGFAVNSCASTTDIVATYKDNGADTCGGAGTQVNAWQCWTDIPTTTAVAVANRATATPSGGILTTFGLEAQAGASNNLNSGSYTCTTTVTAVTN
ncbi:hypothetical protein ACFLYY_01930 [Patescibacteria group bacterium]